jgi:ribonuclease HII
MTNFSIEIELAKQGYKYIAGVDEAGRGPLAGPVVAAAVILPIDEKLFTEINDSKKIIEKKRNELFDLIINNAVSFSIQEINNKTIDTINILNATMKAMENAVFNLKIQADYLIIDGNKYYSDAIPYKTIIKGDTISKSIAAASILAKVYRDKFMIEVANKEFPQYNFAKHKGYGTKEHIGLIGKYGFCEYHRASFLKKINFKNISNKEKELF